MISCPTVTKREIQYHYDWSTAFYRLLWGPHIHHGLWHGEESPAAAQRQLIEAVASRLTLRPGGRVVDVGCGMGGSSVYLARHYGQRVTGITLSPVQRMWATAGARLSGVGGATEFLRADAEQVDFPGESFDVVWSIECTEHLFDKPAFFGKAGRWLKPGGQIAICAGWPETSRCRLRPGNRSSTFAKDSCVRRWPPKPIIGNGSARRDWSSRHSSTGPIRSCRPGRFAGGA